MMENTHSVSRLMKVIHATARIQCFGIVLAALWFFSFSQTTFSASTDKDRWNQKYEQTTYLFGKTPIPFLSHHIHLLPKGTVLDIAMGEGRNGVFLATQGFSREGIRYF